LHLTTSFALRIFRIPVGFSCLWWLMTRRTLTFAVTPKAGARERLRGHPPRIVTVLIVAVFAILVYAVAGALGWVPWRATAGATVASGVWLLLAGIGLVYGAVRVMAPAYASSRRNAHRIAVRAKVLIDGVDGELVDLSVGGAAVRVPRSEAPAARAVELLLPGAPPVRLTVVRSTDVPSSDDEILSLKVESGDWPAFRSMSMWLFHTPPGVIDGIPSGVPAVAATRRRNTSRSFAELIAEHSPATNSHA
jgi:cellulose synthase (UDP-forming)